MRPPGPTPVLSDVSATEEKTGRWLFNPWVRWSAVGTIMLMLSLTALYFYHQSRKPIPETAFNRDPPIANNRSLPQQRQPVVAPPQSIPNPEARQKGSETRRSPAASRPGGFEQQPPSREFPLTADKRPSQSRTVTQPLPMDNQVPGVQRPIRKTKPPETRPSTDIAKPATVPSRLESEKTFQEDQNAAVVQKTVAKRPQPDSAAKAPKSDGYDKAPLLQDGRLRIQAIAWSQNPNDRMAVVNARVIHEGDTLDSFLVVAIRQDDVVVKEKASGTWRVRFGRP